MAFAALSDNAKCWIGAELRDILEFPAEMGYDGADMIPGKAAVHLMRASIDWNPVEWILQRIENNTLRRIAVDLNAVENNQAVMLCVADCKLAGKSFFMKAHGKSQDRVMRILICMIMVGAHCGVWVETAAVLNQGITDAASDDPSRQLR